MIIIHKSTEHKVIVAYLPGIVIAGEKPCQVTRNGTRYHSKRIKAATAIMGVFAKYLESFPYYHYHLTILVHFLL